MTSMPGRLLGIDVGERRVGVAVSDAGQMVASPVGVVMRGNLEFQELAALANQYEAIELIVGLPTGMSGREGPQAAGVRQFAEAAATALDVPIAFWDERLTTVQAERSLIATGQRRQRRKDLIDAVAAALMLQGFLDARTERKSRRS